MRQVILLLIIILSSYTLFSQERTTEDILEGKKVGDIVKGKHVVYKVIGKSDFLFLRNVKNRDTIKRQQNIRVPHSMQDKIYEIVYNHLSPEELVMIIKERTSLRLRYILNNKFKVQEVMFSADVDEYFWSNFPADRFHKIEKAIIRHVKIDERDRQRITEEEIGKQYFSCSIQFQVLQKIRETKEKEAMGNR